MGSRAVIMCTAPCMLKQTELSKSCHNNAQLQILPTSRLVTFPVIFQLLMVKLGSHADSV